MWTLLDFWTDNSCARTSLEKSVVFYFLFKSNGNESNIAWIHLNVHWVCTKLRKNKKCKKWVVLIFVYQTFACVLIDFQTICWLEQTRHN